MTQDMNPLGSAPVGILSHIPSSHVPSGQNLPYLEKKYLLHREYSLSIMQSAPRESEPSPSHTLYAGFAPEMAEIAKRDVVAVMLVCSTGSASG